jgi:pimeloyl-ACP methyl ester carboxylesterase
MSVFPKYAFEDASAEVDAWDRRAERIFTTCGEGRMVWRGWGAGRNVILLHGGAGSWRHWIRNLAVLAERFRVWAPDMPGLGESAMPPEPWAPQASAEIIAAGLDHVLPAGEAFDLVGFSAGAMIAGVLARITENRCRSLVLVGAGGLGSERARISLEKVRSKQGEVRWQAHFANLERLMIADPARIDAQALAIQEWNSSHTRISSVEFARSTLLRDAIAAGRGPLKAIWGEVDAVARTTLAERCRILRSLRPDVDIRIIAGAGHWVAYEAADAFNEILVGLLDGAA